MKSFEQIGDHQEINYCSLYVMLMSVDKLTSCSALG